MPEKSFFRKAMLPLAVSGMAIALAIIFRNQAPHRKGPLTDGVPDVQDVGEPQAALPFPEIDRVPEVDSSPKIDQPFPETPWLNSGGLLLDIDSQPLPGLRVKLRSNSGESGIERITNPEGRFELPAFEMPWMVSVIAQDGNRVIHAEIEQRHLVDGGLTLRLPQLFLTSFIVHGTDGEPISGVKMTVKNKSDALSAHDVGIGISIAAQSGWRRVGFTGEGGGLDFDSLTNHFTTALVSAKAGKSKRPISPSTLTLSTTTATS